MCKRDESAVQILPDGEVNVSSQILEVLSIPAKDALEKSHQSQKAQSAPALKCFFPGFALVKCLEKKTLWFCLAVTALEKAQNQQCLTLWIPLEVNGSLLRMKVIK